MILSPHPKSLKTKSSLVKLPETSTIFLKNSSQILTPIAKLLQEDFKEFQNRNWNISETFPSERNFFLKLSISSSEYLSQEYCLKINNGSVSLTGGDASGVFYGVMTLRQILRQYDQVLPECIIHDKPDFSIRGVMLDVSRDKVPKLSTLFQIVDLLTELKINQLQLYTEHTFAYKNHQKVWSQSSPYNGEDILKLNTYCQKRFIELVPNQNSFGHLYKWLGRSEYKHLAECPDGFDWPWGERNPEPFSLNPLDPMSLEFLSELFEELLPFFQSDYFNVGCDETFDLGQGKSKEMCEKIGKGRVYLNFLKKVQKLVSSHGKRMMFWGDIIINYPELVKELPEQMIALEWGYETDHPFEDHCRQFKEAGIPFLVCPGTSSWNSLVGRTDNCLETIKHALTAGKKYDSEGMLLTDWGDRGHWQPLPVSYFGFLTGASLAWCYDSNEDTNWAEALDLHVFQDSSAKMGQILIELGNMYKKSGKQVKNNSLIFQWLYRNPDHLCFKGIKQETIQNLEDQINRLVSLINENKMKTRDADLVQEELLMISSLLLHGCHRASCVINHQETDTGSKEKLSSELESILIEFRKCWLKRNREGGLKDSLSILESRLTDYFPAKSPQLRIF